MAIFRPGVFRVLQSEEIFAGIRLGFFMFCGYAFQTAGLRYTSASNSGFITGSSVVLVPLILALFWGKRVTLWVYFGTIAAAAGLYFLTVPVTGVAHLNRGDVLTFFAALSYAVHIILVSEYAREHSAAALSVLQVLACAAMTWLTALGANAIRWQPMRLTSNPELWIGITICAIFATAVAFSLQLWAQQYTTPSHAAILFTLEPVFAVITSYLILRERLGLRSIAGAALVLAGILAAELLGPPGAYGREDLNLRDYGVRQPACRRQAAAVAICESPRLQKREQGSRTPHLGIILDVDWHEHRRRCGVSFFVGIDRVDVLQGSSDIVEALEQDFFARWRNLKGKF